MSKNNVLGATMHTAGIFSDMTVDGPEIGTLVVVVDRAKNLPNRKTIGKQDPYCAARLGKEAKKTETDRRGGQTPRWDQEMRFTVHDSPDYYQLKVSVFNDDKKTEIIGETWINLSEVVVPGGGKNDLWHNLSFKGKYAGEIRIEITYYDSRPKPEKSPDKKKQAAPKDVQDTSRDPTAGPRHMKAVKRRPLPNNPTTGSPARPAAAVPFQSQASARGRAPPDPAYDHPQIHAHSGARGLPASDYAQEHIPGHASGRGRALPAPGTVPDYTQTPPRSRQPPQDYQPNQSPLQQVEYNTPPPRFPQSASARHSYDTNGYHPSREPLATAPAPTPLPVSERYEIYDPAPPGSEYIPGNVLGRYDDPMGDGNISPQMTYHAQPEQNHYALTAPEEYSPPPSPGEAPPPPPLHGARSASPLPPPVTKTDSWDMPNFASTPNSVMPDDLYDPSGHARHRQIMPPYAHTKSYQAYSPPRELQRPQSRDQRPPSRDQRPQSRDQQIASRHSYDDQRPQSRGQQIASGHNLYDDQRPQSRGQYATPRHNSYDDRYHNGFESMQPTVEDAPPSPGPGALYHPKSGSFSRGYDERRFDQVPSPAPLNLGGRGSAASGRQSVSTQSSFQMSNGYSSSGSPASFIDRTQNTSISSHRSSINQQYQQPPRRRESEDRMGGLPNGAQVPSSLVAGMDSSIAQEISERIYGDQRSSFSNSLPRNGYCPENVQDPYQQARPASSYGRQGPQARPTSSHGRPDQQVRPTSSYGRPDTSSVFVPASTPNNYSQSMVPTNGTMRERSPAPMGSMRDPRVPMRKSVSPAPVPRDGSRSPAPPRRLSGVPFGPDDYDALNPNVGSTSSKSGVQFSGAPDPKPKHNPDEKIISHDGREIDPSDYLPVDTYAAEYEKKTSSKPAQAPLQTAASLALARPRSQGRPYSMVPASNSSVYMITPNQNSTPSPTPGRTRLQKKSARPQSQMPAPIPLAPITSSYHDNSNAFTPRSLARTSMGDFPSSSSSNENYAPSNALMHYGSHSHLLQQQHHQDAYGGGGGYSGGSGPPIPAKVPMSMHGGNGSYRGADRLVQQAPAPADQAWSLLEEMKSIDLGTGSSRARHGRKGW